MKDNEEWKMMYFQTVFEEGKNLNNFKKGN